MHRISRQLIAPLAAAVLLGACRQPKPTPDLNSVFLGRWQANSTAGRAVLDVLSVEPERVRWGNDLNGVCDSDYSAETLPNGENGRFPDQLIAPTEPTELAYAVVRLTLQPEPCPTGVAVIQLAKPLDGSETLKVVTYDAQGAVRGKYPDLTALREEQASKPQWPLQCTLNEIASTCRTEPAAKDGFTIDFSYDRSPGDGRQLRAALGDERPSLL